LDIDGGADWPADVIPHTLAASLAWLPDDSGFYVTRIPAPGSVPAGEEMYNRHVFFHPLGQDWSADEEIFGAGRAREDWPNVALSHSGRWLVVEVSQGWVRSEVYLLDRSRPERGFTAIHAGVEALGSTVFAGDRLFIHTNEDAPNYALYEVDPERPDHANWRLVLPERQDRVLEGVAAVGGRAAAHERQSAS